MQDVSKPAKVIRLPKPKKLTAKEMNMPANFHLTISSNISKYDFAEWAVVKKMAFYRKLNDIVVDIRKNYKTYIMDYVEPIDVYRFESSYEIGPKTGYPHLHINMGYSGYCKLNLNVIRDFVRKELDGYSRGPNIQARYFADNVKNVRDYDNKGVNPNSLFSRKDSDVGGLPA